MIQRQLFPAACPTRGKKKAQGNCWGKKKKQTKPVAVMNYASFWTGNDKCMTYRKIKL